MKKSYFGTAHSLTDSVPDIDCWIDAAGAESILESIITQEFPLEDISQAIQTAADPGRAFNVTIRF